MDTEQLSVEQKDIKILFGVYLCRFSFNDQQQYSK